MSLFEELIEDKEQNKKIVKSFKTKDSLSPDIFKRDGESFVMLDDVRKKLISVCDNFLDSLGIEFFIHDVVLTGSLSNYNWSEYSDVDLHIILDMDEFGSEDKNEILLRGIFKEFFDAKKDYWNSKHDIKIKNFDVEVYVQDLKEPHVSSGVYSILHNKWIVEPKKDNPNIDDQKILNKAEEIEDKIESLIKDDVDSDIIPKIDCLKDKIKKFRKCGLEKGGEYSYENLTFKLLRRNGSIDKLLKFKKGLTDKKLSLNESPDKIWGMEEVKYSNDDGIPFGIYENEMLIGFNKNYIPDSLYQKIDKNFIQPKIRILNFSPEYVFGEHFTYFTHPEIPVFQRILYLLGIEKKKIDFESYAEHKSFWRSMFFYAGRFWLDSKIISFWVYPDEKETLIKILDMINKKMKLIYGFTVNFNEFKIEVKTSVGGEYELIPLNEYVGKYIDYTEKEIAAPHTLSPEEKIKHPQMIAAKQANIEFTGKKEKGWDSIANRNFTLNKDIAEEKN